MRGSLIENKKEAILLVDYRDRRGYKGLGNEPYKPLGEDRGLKRRSKKEAGKRIKMLFFDCTPLWVAPAKEK